MDSVINNLTIKGPGKQTYSTVTGKSMDVYIGVDIGSTSSDIVLLNHAGEVLYSNYARTMGKPFDTAKAQFEELGQQLGSKNIVLMSVTGSAGRYLAKALDLPFINEVPAQAAAVRMLYPSIDNATIVEMGGQDSKLIFLGLDNGKKVLKDFALNTVCAAGTGSFLDQQAQRLGIEIEGEFGVLACEAQSVPRIAGRCSVFAKSDMIHLQQQATPLTDILAGLCLGLARNLKSNLGCGREFPKPIVFTGGVAANAGVVRAIEQAFELEAGELLVPKHHFFTGAMGAVLIAREKFGPAKKPIDINEIVKNLGGHIAVDKHTPRSPLKVPALPPPKSPVFGETLESATGLVNAYLGVDVGSISTNVVVMDEHKRVLAKAYVMTAGRPLEAVQNGLKVVAPVVAGKVKILGAATTGSGRYLTGDFIGADTVINEITAQAAGAAIVNPSVDTIFEIGGQDSKYISLEDGVVVDFEMNHACAAGTGSFLEEQAQRLDINIKDEFAKLAFESKSPVKLGERCTVFMESDLLNHQQQGSKTCDLVAGLSYSIVSNYLNRVVGRRKIGKNICFQGGTAFNKAVWAAFEMVVGKPIMVPDHHEVTGALGAANIAAEYMNKVSQERGAAAPSKFKGFENLAQMDYKIESFTCEHCSNNCEIKQIELAGSEPLYYGSRCDRYNIKKNETVKQADNDAFEFRTKKLLEYAGIRSKKEKDPSKQTVAIPMALGNWAMLPLFGRFFNELGFNVIASPQTTKTMIRTGVEMVAAQTCFPVKVMYGHVAHLLRGKPDFIFLPSVVSMPATYENNQHNNLCPYVQSIPYQIKTAFMDKLGTTKLLSPVIRQAEGANVLQKCFIEMAPMLGVSAAAIKAALAKALAAQKEFEAACKQKGREIVDSLGPDEKLFILVSRPYNGCDEGLNLELPSKLAAMGARVMPMDMLELGDAPLTGVDFHSKMYWKYGQHIMRAAEVIAKDPRFYGIYLSNFSCGPDSFIMTFFKHIMASKPCLQLELDEHSADAGVITRLEAFFESLKHYKPVVRLSYVATKSEPEHTTKKRTIYVPYMGTCSHGMAASFKSFGQPARVLPVADEEALIEGRRFTTGKECLPCAITAGDMLKILKDKNTNPDEVAFFMPGSIGPCRFGMYCCLHELVLQYAGYKNVPVLAPNQDVNFYAELSRITGSAVMRGFTKQAWISTIGIDLLNKVILKVRPYAVDPRHAQKRYDESLKMWVGAIERREKMTSLLRIMTEIADMLGSVAVDHTHSKPLIGIVGEIYVRSHEYANQQIIARLESLGAACELASLAEWIYYTNFCRHRLSRRRGKWKEFVTNAIEGYFQHKIEKTIAKPLEAKFGALAEEPVEHSIALAAPYIHESFEGEAVLSAGKMVEYHHKGIGGVINVMPFTCMPSTIVSTQTMRISGDCGNMPILNVSFDGQSDPTLTTRLEAFVEQVRQRSAAESSHVHVAG